MRRSRSKAPARWSARARGRLSSAASPHRAGLSSAEEVEPLFADYLGYYNAHIVERTRLYPGVDKALAAFARAGWRQAVCTNKIEVSAKLLIEKLGIAERFAFICGQDTFGVGKPDAKPLLETIAASGGARERAIMVGDSGTDIKTARAANVPVVAVDFGYTDVPIQELGPDLVISHFDQLMQACDTLLALGGAALGQRFSP